MAATFGVGRKGSRYHRLDNIPTNTFTPRTYQIQLLDAALQKNTLLCQGCPNSKLFLALMVAKEMSSATRLSIKDGGKRTYYLTDSEEEVESISSTLPHHTDLKVGSYPPANTQSSEQVQDFDQNASQECSACSPHHYSIWQQLVENNNIIVCTGTNFLESLKNNCVELGSANLLVFDDCHRSVSEGHPYASIVSLVQQLGTENFPEPRILGVTAAIAGTDCSDPDQLKVTISSMESAMHAKAQTSMLILTERFGCRPRQQVIHCDLDDIDIVGIDEEQAQLRQTLEGLLLRDYHFFLDCREQLISQAGGKDPGETPRQVLEQCLTILSVLGPWCCSSVGEYFHMQMEKIVKQERCDVHKRCMRCVMTTLRVLTHTFESSFHPDYCVHEFLAYTTPKVRALVQSLRRFKPEVDFIIVSNNSDDPDGDDLSDLSDDGENDDDDDSMSGSDAEDDDPNKSSFASKPVHIAVKRNAEGITERITGPLEEEEKNLCGIVFVENRYIAFGLSKVIEEVCAWDADLCFVKSCHITGQGLKGAGGSAKQQRSNRACKRQEEALRKFRTQEVNLVIATPELEEGIDIPKCNLVVRFDPPKDYRSYTLSKGRARARDASFIILLDADSHEGFQSRLEVFRGIEQVLLGDAKSQSKPERKKNDGDTDDSDSEQNSVGDNICDQDVLPPFKTIPSYHNSPQVTMQGAIALVNRYCAKLPSDAFTHLTPHCRLQRTSAGYEAYLRLPINSPVKQEIQGPAMRSKKLAKMAVALEMCKILHGIGELDDQLMPVGKEMFVYEEEEEWADEEDSGGQARPGTTKRKQYYTKKVANAMVNCQPKPAQKCYLYLISLSLTGPITEEQNTRGRLIYAPEDTKQTLGLLLDKPIPEMPNFPVYTRSGEVTASVDLLCGDMILSEEEISCLQNFHQFVFSGVLHLEKDPMEFNPQQAEYSCVIVPLNGEDELRIDWHFVDKVIQFMSSQKRADTSKRKKGSSKEDKNGEDKENEFVFRMEDFEDAVVMPSYRNMDQPQHFYVAEIRTDLNPLSPFPSPELYKTFQDYYTTKYGLQISCKDQPLLDVDHTSARLNLLTPRYMNPKGMALPTSSAETKRARRENLQQKQILVPELCDVHIFPASLWRKAVCLPAILYRTNCLLLAEELRQRVANQTGIGQENLPSGFRFPQLDFGFDTSPEKLIESESSSGDSCKNGNNMAACSKESETSVTNLNKELTECLQNSEFEVLSQTFTVEKADPEQKEIFSSTHNPCLGTDASVDKADSASSSDTDSGIMSSGSDSNLGPNVPVVVGPKKFDSKQTNPYIEQDMKQKDYSHECRETKPAPCLPTVVASSSYTLPGQTCTNSCASNNSDKITINASTNSRDLDCSNKHIAGGAHHITHVSHFNDSKIVSGASQAINAEETPISIDIGQTPIPIKNTDYSKPITADTCDSSSKSSNEFHHNEPQGLTPAARNVPCPSMPSAANPLCIPHSSEKSTSSTLSVESLSPSTTSCNIGCELNNSYSSANPQAKESLQQLPNGVHASFHHQVNSSCHSQVQNHQSCVQINGCDDNLELRSNEIPSQMPNCGNATTADKLEKRKTCQNVRDAKEVKISNPNSSHSNFKSCSNMKQSSHSTARPSSDKKGESQGSDASIVMNTLGKELSGLEIDLICPDGNHTNSSSTFQACDVSETVKSHFRSNYSDMPEEHKGRWNSSSENPLCNGSSPDSFEKRPGSNDADTIKFSFNADIPENTHDDEGKVIIDRWDKDNQNEPKNAEIKESQACLETDQIAKNKETAEKGIVAEKSDSLKIDSTKESNQSSIAGKVPENAAQPQNHSTKVLVPPATKCVDEMKTFDIGFWNKKKSSPSFVQNSSKSEIEEALISLQDTNKKSSGSTSDCMGLDEDRDLSSFPGPSPCLLLQALTMSNANDFFSLERLETIGDSFLKYAITVYLYCCYPGIHEGKLSYLRSKQVSNYNLYRLGRRKCLAELMVATKFEPYENWLPPGFIINEERRRGPVPKVVVVPPGQRDDTGYVPRKENTPEKDWPEDTGDKKQDEACQFNAELAWLQQSQEQDQREEATRATASPNSGGSGGKGGVGLIPYSLQQHHGLPDKSLADCVEALIGCYLTTCGRKAALLFMSWLGLKVLPKRCGNSQMEEDDPPWKVSEQQFEELRCPPSPMFFPCEANQSKLEQLLEGFSGLEDTIQYRFRDRSYLLQAFTHASYHYNTITDCYQRIEFLGDAILDYVITRHLYEDSQKHSPGILTDLRSALVNNNIFAALAVKWGFHKYFKAISPALFQVIDTFVKFQEGKDQDHIDIDEEYQEMSMEDPGPEEGLEDDDEDDEEEVEMEIPKALGDIFESVAGAIYLDSGMSLDAVWKVYYRMMKPHIDKYLKSIPKSPVRELLETEPETAKFERPQRTVNGKVRVTVNVVGKGEFSGIGRNYRIAKSAAAKRALRSIRFMGQNSD